MGDYCATEDWSSLPEKPLAVIFCYLDEFDRFCAALTCKTWSETMNNPDLWSSKTMLLDFKDWQQALKYEKFINRFGFSLECLDFNCYYQSQGYCAEFMQLLEDICTKCRLLRTVSFCLMTPTGLMLDTVHFQHVADKLGDIVRFQKNLETLTFEDCYFPSAIGKDLLTIVGTWCGGTIKHLRLMDYFWTLPADTSFLFNNFLSLVTLTLDNKMVCGGLLATLRRNVKKTLKQMNLLCDSRELRLAPPDDEDWNLLVSSCSQMRVRLYIVVVNAIAYFPRFILPSMPVQEFKMKNVWPKDHSTINELKNVLTFLHNNYSGTLESFYFCLPDNHEALFDNDLIELVRKCPCLRSFTYQGHLDTLQPVVQICRMQLNGIADLEKIHFLLFYANGQQEQEAEGIAQQLQEDFSVDSKVDFVMEAALYE